jgi:hypothetical protein
MTAEEKDEKEKKRMPKTVRPKFVEIDGRGYDKCPYPDCGFMVEDTSYNPKARSRIEKLYSPDPNWNIYEHIKQVHGFVWLRKGKTAGWWPLSKLG